MKKAIIADISSLSYEKKIYGHFIKTASLFGDVMRGDYEVVVAGAKEYKSLSDCKSLMILPFSRKKQGKSLIIKTILDFIGEFINTKKVLNQKCDVLIFQSYSKLPIYLGLLLFHIRAKSIYMIEYQKTNYRGLALKFQLAALKRINGIIASSVDVGEFFGVRYIVVPDYFFTKTSEIHQDTPAYDFGVFGTIANDKLYEDVVSAVNNTNFNLIIAGKFLDPERLRRINEMSSSNVTILDKYLTDSEYYEIMSKCRYIVLPYNPKKYSGKSSGVLLDALYHGKPVIVPRIDSFDLVETYGVGLTYCNSFAEILKLGESHLREVSYVEEINAFNLTMKSMTDRFLEFIRGE